MSSVSTEAAAKLSDRGWRWRNSWWVWLPLISCGLLSWLGFIVAATRMKERRYWVAAAACGAFGMIAFALIGVDDGRDTIFADVGTGAALLSMVVAATVAGIWNRDYLVKVAERQVSGYGYGAPTTPRVPVPPPNAPQGFLGVSGAEYYAPAGSAAPPAYQPPPPPPPAPAYRPPAPPTSPVAQGVDVNTATAEQLVADLAISPEVAARVVQRRDAVGRYASLDDLVADVGLQPHELVRFRNRVTFGADPTTQPPPSQPSGRVLDF